MKVGDKLRKIRVEKKITQDEMAIALDISQRAYSKIENNEIQIKLDRLQRIADVLNIDARLLLPENNGHHFENVSYSQISCSKVINQNSNKAMELYDNIIKRQQDEIDYLKGVIEMIKK